MTMNIKNFTNFVPFTREISHKTSDVTAVLDLTLTDRILTIHGGVNPHSSRSICLNSGGVTTPISAVFSFIIGGGETIPIPAAVSYLICGGESIPIPAVVS